MSIFSFFFFFFLLLFCCFTQLKHFFRFCGGTRSNDILLYFICYLGFDAFGDLLQPSGVTGVAAGPQAASAKPASNTSNKVLTGDLDSSLASLAMNLTINKSQTAKYDYHFVWNRIWFFKKEKFIVAGPDSLLIKLAPLSSRNSRRPANGIHNRWVWVCLWPALRWRCKLVKWLTGRWFPWRPWRAWRHRMSPTSRWT